MPPVSSVMLFIVALAAFIIAFRVRVEPVNATLSTSGWETNVEPASLPDPLTIIVGNVSFRPLEAWKSTRRETANVKMNGV